MTLGYFRPGDQLNPFTGTWIPLTLEPGLVIQVVVMVCRWDFRFYNRLYKKLKCGERVPK